MILAPARAPAGTLPAGAETWLYGLTTTSMEEGNGRIVRVDVETLSSDMQNPTQFEEIATVEYANDFMAGTSVNGLYYCYYNTYDASSGVSMQHFGTLDFKTGDFSTIAEANHVDSDDVTDMMDMTYDPVGGGLLGLDRQYVPSQDKFVSTIQNISMARGKLQEIFLFDRKYVAICSDGEGGYYLATLDKDADEVYRPEFYKADGRFNVTRILTDASSLAGESSFAHSMTIDDNRLYLVTGSVVTRLDLTTHNAENFYLEKGLYGVTFVPGGTVGVCAPTFDDSGNCEPVYYDMQGRRLSEPRSGEPCIRLTGSKAEKVMY